jgi:hypothetical protein
MLYFVGIDVCVDTGWDRHRCLLQTRSWTLPDPPIAPPGGTIYIFFNLGSGHCRTHWQRPLGALPSTSSSASVVDVTEPTGSAPVIDVFFSLGGGRYQTHR